MGDYLNFGDNSDHSDEPKTLEEKFVNNIVTAKSEREQRMWVGEWKKQFPGQEDRLKQLLYATEKVKNKTVETLKHAGNRMQEEGEKILDNAVKVSDQVNDKVFDGLNAAAGKILEKGGELVDKANKQFEIVYENATGYKLEHGLSQNFDEDAFVKFILDGKITFSSRQREEYDFVTPVGTRTILTSEHGIFKFEVLSKLDNSVDHVFKINNIDCTTHLDLTQKGIKINVSRLHSVIVNGKDQIGEITDVSL